ncbi:hypothetical protein CKO28_03205 [Rhodovibrio sodomensis]|uniref:Transcription factor zinc-finger domain-containing protein n=1 Tax=Rhodovibrio sodomensis TaxID=1088 RepID=A0ABS1DAA4_9PROT|nr:hypothetical protein [Rhodovibrio sodomensis]MBK1667052.1 hypothetical protein [Rhodovibrio sodomensis]
MNRDDIQQVTCASCKTAFTDGIMGRDQADGCAADIHDTGVSGNYGSRHDCDHYHWVARPDWAVDGVVCDDCVDKLIQEGAIAEGFRYPWQMPGYVEPPEEEEDDDSPLVCPSCETAYHSVISHKHRQANGCACEVEDRGVSGHYGSRELDGELLVWRERPDWVKDGVICDTCVRKLRNDGALGTRIVGDAFGVPALTDADTFDTLSQLLDEQAGTDSGSVH